MNSKMGKKKHNKPKYHSLTDLTNTTYEQCLDAVKHKGLEIVYVDPTFQTYELCLAAVKNNSRAIKYMRFPQKSYIVKIYERIVGLDRTDDILETAIKQGYMQWLHRSDIFTDKLWREVSRIANNSTEIIDVLSAPYRRFSIIRRQSRLLRWIDWLLCTCLIMMITILKWCTRTETNILDFAKYICLSKDEDELEEICLSLVEVNGQWLAHMNAYRTKRLHMTAVKQYGFALLHVCHQFQTPEICLAAVKQNGMAVVLVRSATSEIYEAAVQQNGGALRYINNPTFEMCLIAMNNCYPRTQRDLHNYYVPHYFRDRLATNMITDICIAMRPLKLPSYVLLEIIDWVLSQFKNTLWHYDKIKQIIRINEGKLVQNQSYP